MPVNNKNEICPILKKMSKKNKDNKKDFLKYRSIEKKVNEPLIELVTEAIKKPESQKKSFEKKATRKEAPLKKAPVKKAPGKEAPSLKVPLPPEAEKITAAPLKRSHKKLWIILPVVFVVVALMVLAGLYYYALYFNKPNFEENEYNKMLQSTSEPVAPGEEIQYSIEFKNTGNTDITELSIETEIPANTEIVSSSSSSKIIADGKKIMFYVASLAKESGDKVFFTVKVNNPLDNGTELKVSNAIFNYISREKQKQFNISQDLENTVKSSPEFSGFSLSYKDLNGKKISMGDDILFNITFGNTGDMNAADVKLINILPDKFILYENSLKPDAAYDKKTGEIIWGIAKINTGEVKDFSFKAKIGDSFDNLEIFKDIASLTYENESIKEVSAEDKVFGFPNFSTSTNTVEHPAAGDVWAGDNLKYTVNIINSGLRAGENIEIVCPIPKGTSYVKNSALPADSSVFDQEANTLKWKIKIINVNEPLSLTFEARISGSLTGGGTIASAFSITGDDQSFEIESAAIKVRSYIFLTIVCMGDSQIVKSNWPAYLDGALESTYPHAEYKTIGSGVSQQRAYEGVRRFDSTVAVYKPQVVVIGYGTNDVGGSTSLFAAGIQELINKAKGIGATVIVHSIGYIDTGIHPAKKGWPSYNAVLRQVCANNGVPYVDIAGPMSQNPGLYISSDGMHWTPEGGQLVAHLVFNTLRNYLDGEGKRK